MNNQLDKYLQTNFPNLDCKAPLFYSWDYGIRFELENGNNGQRYFDEVIERALTLYEDIFHKSDRIFLVYQHGVIDNEIINPDNFCFQQIIDIDKSTIAYKLIEELYDPEYTCELYHRAIIDTVGNKINHGNILTAIANSHYGDRKPQIGGEVYFVNQTKNIIFHMYDDRGLDIVAIDKNTLTRLYTKFNDWILDYDREKIDKIFLE